MGFEGLMLLLIENGIIHKDKAIDVINGLIEVKSELAGTQESTVIALESIRLLQATLNSLSAANSSPLLPHGCDGRGSCLVVNK